MDRPSSCATIINESQARHPQPPEQTTSVQSYPDGVFLLPRDGSHRGPDPPHQLTDVLRPAVVRLYAPATSCGGLSLSIIGSGTRRQLGRCLARCRRRRVRREPNLQLVVAPARPARASRSLPPGESRARTAVCVARDLLVVVVIFVIGRSVARRGRRRAGAAGAALRVRPKRSCC